MTGECHICGKKIKSHHKTTSVYVRGNKEEKVHATCYSRAVTEDGAV